MRTLFRRYAACVVGCTRVFFKFVFKIVHVFLRLCLCGGVSALQGLRFWMHERVLFKTFVCFLMFVFKTLPVWGRFSATRPAFLDAGEWFLRLSRVFKIFKTFFKTLPVWGRFSATRPAFLDAGEWILRLSRVIKILKTFFKTLPVWGRFSATRPALLDAREWFLRFS